MTPYYDSLTEQYLSECTQLKRSYNTYSFYRLLLALAILVCLYLVVVSGQWMYLPVFAVLFILFVGCVKKHSAILRKKKLTENLATINREEARFLAFRETPFDAGTRYADSAHFYTYDLDIFGKDSLFQHLNRTATYIGEVKLAESLQAPFAQEEVLHRQEAIRELSARTEWRQGFAARGRLMKDSETGYQKLLDWSESRENAVGKAATFLAFLLPALWIAVMAACLLGWISWKWILPLVTANLALTGTQLSKIKGERIDARNVAETIGHYGVLLKEIEKEPFSSVHLKRMQEVLQQKSAGNELSRLSRLFLKLEGINFGLGALVLNGTLVYHVHVLNSLLRWKRAHAGDLRRWLEILGETEALNSYANFAFNNPAYAWPVLTSAMEIEFEDMGHPLIPESLRVNNRVVLRPDNFMILTGSNMSGKSTFLRAIGVNRVLAGAGAPVCAGTARIHLLPLLVSMRQSDSLSSGESYFFAEVKRLKAIMDQLERQPCLVLLDEILRGTNSDDKQAGTIGVIRKIISRPVPGAIATHDLSVCRLADEYPDRLENKNFEVEMINGELAFDYKLRDGVCRNKSATFLMKKMGII